MKRALLLCAIAIAACSGDDPTAPFASVEPSPEGASATSPDGGTSLGSESGPIPSTFDFDGDGVLDEKDNCPKKANTSQVDLNVNGIGDACDTDLLLLFEQVTLKHVGAEVSGKRYFVASHPNFGTEFWVSDGTAAGSKVIDSTVGPPAITTGIVKDLGVAAGKIFTVFQENGGGNKLWAIEPGSSALTSLGAVNYWSGFLTLNDKAFFNAQLMSNASAGVEIAASDGTFGGTVIIEDMRPGTASFIARLLGATSSHLYFTESVFDAGNGIYHWSGLWKSSGSSAPTQISTLSDIRYLGQTAQYIYFAQFVNYNGGGKSTAQVYRTSAGSNSITQVSSFTGTNRAIGLSSVRAGTTLYFRAEDPDVTSPSYNPNQRCIYKIADGDSAITKVLCATSLSSSELSLLGLTESKFLYYVDSKLLAYDTTKGGSTLLKECSGSAPHFTSFAGGYLFDCKQDNEIHFTDGTVAGTKKIFGDPTAKSAMVDVVTVTKGFLRVVQPDNTYAIWTTDGTAANTTKLFGPTAGGHTLMPVGDHVLISDSKGSLWAH